MSQIISDDMINALVKKLEQKFNNKVDIQQFKSVIINFTENLSKIIEKTPNIEQFSSNELNLLYFSNWFYIIPMFVIFMNYGKQKFDFSSTIDLLITYSLIILLTLNYHSCEKNSIEKKFIPLDNSQCPNGFNMKYDTSKFLESAVYYYAIAITLMYVLPIPEYLRHIIKTVMLFYIIILSGFDYLKNHEIILSIPTILLLLYFIYFEYTMYSNRSNYKLFYNLSGIVLIIISLSFSYSLRHDNITYHTIWHIFGAFATMFLLLGTSSYRNVGLFQQ